MKIFVLNSSGNVGKSLISRELFYSRLEDPLIIEVETVNRGSKEIAHLNVQQFESGDDFMEVYVKLMEYENVIVDVGASNLAAFWEQMSGYAGLEELFDLFVIPTVSGDKEMTDTYKTINFLRSQNISDSKIKIIFNRVKKSVENDFNVLLSTDFDYDITLSIRESELFKELGLMKQTINDIFVPDLNFYKPLILKATDPHEKLLLVKKDLANRMAASVQKDLDYIFNILTGLEVAAQPKQVTPVTPVKEDAKVEADETSEVNDDDEEL